MLELTQSDFHSHVETNAILVVEFVASGAPQGPHPLARQFPDVTFAHVDPAREPGIGHMFGITAAPALLIFREAIVLYLEPGAHSPQRIQSLLDRINTLDLGTVRAAIEKDRAETAVHMRRMCPAARRGDFQP